MYCPITASMIEDLEEYELDPSISCSCIENCDSKCECFQRYGFAYNEFEKINSYLDDSKPIFECNDNCTCSFTCSNRLVQRGSKCKISIAQCGSKGLGAIAEENIEKGTYIGNYVGVITDEHREGPYIFQVRENTPTTTYITTLDAQYYGNLTRFINHSCNPNLQAFVVRINHIIPTISFFSIKDIKKGKELCFEYRKHNNQQKCLCGSQKCRGQF